MLDVALDTVRYRPWQAGDDQLLADLGPALSPASLYTRFLTGTPTLPRQYLSYVRTAPRSHWDAVVAVHDGSIVGWAEFGRESYYAPEAELAVMVVDAWQGRGIGGALARRALERAVLSGVRTLVAEVLAENTASVRMIQTLAAGVYAVQREGDVLHFRLPVGALAAAA